MQDYTIVPSDHVVVNASRIWGATLPDVLMPAGDARWPTVAIMLLERGIRVAVPVEVPELMPLLTHIGSRHGWNPGTHHPLRLMLSADLWRATWFLLSGSVIGLVWFSVIVVLANLALVVTSVWIIAAVVAAPVIAWRRWARIKQWRWAVDWRWTLAWIGLPLLALILFEPTGGGILVLWVGASILAITVLRARRGTRPTWWNQVAAVTRRRWSFGWIGIPCLALSMPLWIAGARAERWRLGVFSGVAIPAPYIVQRPDSRYRLLRQRLSDPAVWRDLAYLVLLFPLGIIELIIVVVGIGVPVALATLPLYYFLIPGGVQLYGGTDTARATGWAVDTFWEALLAGGAGLLLAVPAFLLIIGVAHGHLAFGRRLLGTSDQTRLAERVEVLTRSRSAVMEAQLAERQRIERDLHDGAQQRLVALAMTLGMAKEKLTTDPEAAAELVAASHEEAKRAMSELRVLVRGIHPAVLTDRGLDAAISAIAGRSPIPVSVDVRLDGRLPEAIEVAAYFVVVEALTNVAKHSGAKEARVAIWQHGDDLFVEIVDDGHGGAASAIGTGLDGLADRLAALDGSLHVHSPPGGPTWIRAEIPSGS